MCDIISSLPPEIVQLIFAKLPPEDLRNALDVCPQWRSLSSDKVFWKRKCHLDGYLETPSKDSVLDKAIAGTENYWWSVYLFNESLHRHWQENIFERMDVLEFEENFSHKINYFDDEIIITTNFTDKLLVYHYEAEFVQIFDIEIEDCFSKIFVCRSSDFIVYANVSENRLRVYNIQNDDTLVNMPMKDNVKLKNLAVSENIASLLFDGEGSCWIVNILTGEIVYSIDLVMGISFFANHLVLRIMPDEVKIINLESKATIVRFSTGEDERVEKMFVSGDYLVSFFGLVDRWSVWNIKTSKKVHSATHKFTDAFKIGPTMVLLSTPKENSAGLFGSLEAWDFLTNTLRFVIGFNCSNQIFTMNDHYIFVYAFQDCIKIKIYCIRTGTLVGHFEPWQYVSQIFATNKKFAYDISVYAHFVVHVYEQKITPDLIRVQM